MRFRVYLLAFCVFNLCSRVSLAISSQVGDPSLLQAFKSEVQINEIVRFYPVASHHFNLKAKNNCGVGQVLQATEEFVECQMKQAGDHQVELFICDDPQSYCRREQVLLNVLDHNSWGHWWKQLKHRLFGS